jgi:hypothetical protein
MMERSSYRGRQSKAKQAIFFRKEPAVILKNVVGVPLLCLLDSEYHKSLYQIMSNSDNDKFTALTDLSVKIFLIQLH